MSILNEIRRFGVEIVSFIYFFSWHLIYTSSQTYLNTVTGDLQEINACKSNLTSKEIYHKERDTVILSMKLSLAELLPVIPVTIFFAIRSDLDKRRRLLIWLPFVGNALFCFFYIIHFYQRKYLFLLYFGNLCMAFCGHMYMFQAGVHSRIGDHFQSNQRLLQMATQESFIQLAMGLGILVGGIWDQYLGFLSSYFIGLVISSIAVPLTFLLVVEDKLNTENSYEEIDVKSWRHIFCEARYWLIFLSFQLFIFVHNGEERIRILYFKNKPLCFTSLTIGLTCFVLGLVASIGTVGSVYIFSRMGLKPLWIGVVGFGSKIVGSIFLAVANSLALAMLAQVTMIFYAVPFSVARSFISEIAGEGKQGVAQAILHSGLAINAAIEPPILDSIYAATLDTVYGMTFYCCAIVLIVSAVLLIIGDKMQKFNRSCYNEESIPLDGDKVDQNV
ncbi:DgyrCDS6510 [Dimorphilus gyrociliatus]|uniref:DgyrCDS6510 n=1 Tax=Dimorphilus gyrociliatus TaxID=2664684 RepID=A0A7I8VT18_9ANNE|nr:DgyrCDS6510 [Dimorphilus gyrociliatus]